MCRQAATDAIVSGNYFRTFGLRPHAGRLLADRDNVPESADYKIVGVVADTTYTSVRSKQHRMYFLPILQRATE
jgi:hypothetical protein